MVAQKKLERKINLLEYKIQQEKKLDNEKIDSEALKLPIAKLFYPASKFSYSQAMGEFQIIIDSALKGICQKKHLKWAQVPYAKKWYEVLKMNVDFKTTPKNIFVFIDNLRKSSKLFAINNLEIYKIAQDNHSLHVRMQLIAFRVYDEKK